MKIFRSCGPLFLLGLLVSESSLAESKPTSGISPKVTLSIDENHGITPPRDISEARSVVSKRDEFSFDRGPVDSRPRPSSSSENETPSTQDVHEKDMPVFSRSSSKPESESSTYLTRMMLGLGAIFTLLAGIFIGFRRYLAKSPTKRDGTQIRLVTQHFLGPKKSLAVIKVAGETVLVGITDSNINLIKPLSLLEDDTNLDFNQRFSGSTEDAIGSQKNSETHDMETDVADDFQVGSVRDIVSRRIKSLKALS